MSILQVEAIEAARTHAIGNRNEIEVSKYAGCFSCCSVFDRKSVIEWRDEWVSPEMHSRVAKWTAICPRCGETTVIGSVTGLLDDQAYLPLIRSFLDN